MKEGSQKGTIELEDATDIIQVEDHLQLPLEHQERIVAKLDEGWPGPIEFDVRDSGFILDSLRSASKAYNGPREMLDNYESSLSE